MLKVGDVVLNPKQRGLCCVISEIQDTPGRGYFVLQPFTTHGWPSRNRRNWQYYHISTLSTLKPLQKKGGYKHLLVCPKCETKGKSLFQAPLRKFNIYDPVYQCQLCKEKFTF